jgi:hypothetical protein
VALPKYEGRKLGLNPVWYIAMTPGRDWLIANALDELRAMALESDFHSQPEARIFPFIEGMGVWPKPHEEILVGTGVAQEMRRIPSVRTVFAAGWKARVPVTTARRRTSQLADVSTPTEAAGVSTRSR